MGQQADAGSYGVSISPDGRYVTFGSNATNLVPDDLNGVMDVFVYDRQTRHNRARFSSPQMEHRGMKLPDLPSSLLMGLILPTDLLFPPMGVRLHSCPMRPIWL